ncbi:hypothetical protein YPPY42_3222, partial [Yersinia pestis PY-42]|jgi:hypothetical protein
MAISS